MSKNWELYPDGHVEEAPVRVPHPVPHNVKFRHAEEVKVCDSELCPHLGNVIEPGTKYARVQRIGPRRKAVTEFFHAKCYDNEFDEGSHAEMAS
jgi:hypothetical protein